MISLKRLEELTSLKHDAFIVSAYLRADPRLACDRHQPLTQFKGLVRRFDQFCPDRARRDALERERPRIERHLQGLGPSSRGVVIFACEPAGLWEPINLDVLTPSHLAVETRPVTSFLMRIIEQYPRLAVMVVQKDQGVIYTTELRRGGERARVESEVQGRHDQGGRSQSRFQRHIDYQVRVHLKDVIDALARLQTENPFGRLAIGGTPDTVAEALRLLPDSISKRVIGTFPIDFKHASEDEILEQACRINQEYERKTEQELVDRLDEAKHPGGRGVVGLDQTLKRLAEHRIDHLIVAEQVELKGTVCEKCGHLDTRPFDHCPACGAAGREADNIVDLAMERALLDGARIESLEGTPRDWLREHGGIGAILRY
ncbi:hypothetical protein LLG95_05660 [bacterium]|nr:hypothetical protein [bacterium]